MPISTLNQQIAQKAIELLNQSLEAPESLLDWFRSLGITPLFTESLLPGCGDQYYLPQEQFKEIAEMEITIHPDWFLDPAHPLQHAAPGLYVAFLGDNGRYVITTVVEVKAPKRGAPSLLAIEGWGKGWYSEDGQRTTKDGHPFQGSAYAGKIFPVNDAIHATIERQKLLSEITGYHQADFGRGGPIHNASIPTLRVIRDMLLVHEHSEQSSTPETVALAPLQAQG